MENFLKYIYGFYSINIHEYLFTFIFGFCLSILFDWNLKSVVQYAYSSAKGVLKSNYKFPNGFRLFLVLFYVTYGSYCYANVVEILDFRILILLILFVIYTFYSVYIFIKDMDGV